MPSTGSGVLLLGKLMRRDRRLFTWKWRDFVLERSRLQYFSAKGNRKGDILLTPQTPITIRMCSEPKPFGFLLFIKDTKLTLAAATERERRQWIDVFCDVFHASVEQTPTDNKAERRARPTYLPIPDLGVEADGTSNSVFVQQSSSITSVESGEFVDGSNYSTPVMAHNVLDNEDVKRDSFGEDVIPILESRMTYGPIKELFSRITFPPSLANGDLLVGVGPIVRRMGWTDERIMAVGMYIDPEAATRELEKFNGRVAKSLYGDQQFYNHLLFHTTFRRSFVITARKRVSKSVLTALLRDELTPRMGPNAAATSTFLGFIEKSLKKAESMVMRIHEDDRFEYRLRGQLYPPIASHALCKCIQALFFDSNSIQHDAKRGLIERLPSLWGGEVLDVHDEIFGSLHERIQNIDSEDEEDTESDDEDDCDDDEDDSEAEDLFGGHGGTSHHSSDDEEGHKENNDDEQEGDHSVTTADKRIRSKRNNHFDLSAIYRRPSTQDEWADYDDKELEMLQRQSRSLMVHFGPILDRDSNVIFSGDLAVDGSALLGTWSHQFSVSPDEYDAPSDPRQHRFTVGLYVDPGAIGESLLKFKGLSIGSIVQNTDYFHQFSSGTFQKHLVIKVDAKIKLRVLLKYFDLRLQSLVSSFEDVKKPFDNLAELWDSMYPQEHHQQLELTPKDEARFSIAPDKKMVLKVKKRGLCKEDKKQNNAVNFGAFVASYSEDISDSVDATLLSSQTSIAMLTGASTPSLVGNSRGAVEMELALPAPPFHLAFESLIFGFHAMDPSARTQLMERIPNLLDLVPDDLAHTYHDEIQALRENYKRQKPENRVKVGYLSISFEKRKLQKSAEKGGAKEVTMVPSRWSKRWCRLDGTLFSYYSHKRSRKYRDMMELTRCEVVEITANSGPDVARFAWEKGESDSVRIAVIKPNGEILALRTETIYEGEEWLESLTDASKVRRYGDSPDNWVAWDANFSQRQRRSSSNQDGTPNRGDRSGSSGSTSTSERHSGVGQGSVVNRKSHANSVAASNLPLDTTYEEDDGYLDDTNVDEYDSDEDVVKKDGSLLAWMQEDPRHAIIAFLLGFIVYLASMMHRVQPVLVNSTEVP
uniref:PH domain-containing protein n=1 Tax=Hyaloperonospora arabidopsidis (strain Emoy2) TaxID=559515 RepID=M4B5J6_HYAAE